MRVISVLIICLVGLTSYVGADFSSSILDPALMTQYMPDSKIDKNDPETIARNFQAEMIKKMFLQSAIGDQLSLFEDDEDSGLSFQTGYANELIMNHLAHDLARKDLLKLNEILSRNISGR